MNKNNVENSTPANSRPVSAVSTASSIAPEDNTPFGKGIY